MEKKCTASCEFFINQNRIHRTKSHKQTGIFSWNLIENEHRSVLGFAGVFSVYISNDSCMGQTMCCMWELEIAKNKLKRYGKREISNNVMKLIYLLSIFFLFFSLVVFAMCVYIHLCMDSTHQPLCRCQPAGFVLCFSCCLQFI